MMKSTGWRSKLALSLVLACMGVLPSLGCAGDQTAAQGDDLTSVTARERVLTFEGYVYVHPDSSDSAILEAVRQQTRTAFGALRTQNVAVGDRELAGVDTSTFLRESLELVEDGDSYETLRVRYSYTGRAVVPKPMARRSALSLGLLHGDYPAQAERVLIECTPNTSEDAEMLTDIWYVFNPALDSCKQAMTAEQRAIDLDRQGLDKPERQVVPSELERLYIPMTAKLAAAPATNKKLSPEYDRLWQGGIEPGILSVALVNGLIDHGEPGGSSYVVDDPGYWEMMEEMDQILQARPNLKLVAAEPPTDLSTFTVSGKTIDGLTFQSFVDWEIYQWGFPSWMNAEQKLDLRRNVANRLLHRWLTFEETVLVSIDGAPAEPVTIRIRQYFGAEEDEAPYLRAVREHDVFLYNGHSYIGEGPLDPENFDDADFPESYQLLFIDSCLSFNYYNKDYFAYKERGSQDLDIITNGLESFADGAGAAQGRFVAALLSGTQPTYLNLLEIAATTGSDYAWGKDALRVVDGELDNVYREKDTPIVVTSP